MANATHNGQQTNGRVTIDDEPESPLQHLSPEQIEEIGREFDELHQQVKDSLGDRDARYIRSIIALQRRLALLGRVELIASRWRLPWILGASTLGLAKIRTTGSNGAGLLATDGGADGAAYVVPRSRTIVLGGNRLSSPATLAPT